MRTNIYNSRRIDRRAGHRSRGLIRALEIVSREITRSYINFRDIRNGFVDNPAYTCNKGLWAETVRTRSRRQKMRKASDSSSNSKAMKAEGNSLGKPVFGACADRFDIDTIAYT